MPTSFTWRKLRFAAGLSARVAPVAQGDKLTASEGGNRIAIVGAGKVGATCAYTLLLRGLTSELVLIDADREKAEGEAMDLNHASLFTGPAVIRAGEYADCVGAAITILAAGAGRKPGETRLDLLRKNGALFRQVVPEIARHNPDGILLVATNPVDVLTYAAWKLSGYPTHRVLGSGTILDAARLRHRLSRHFDCDPRAVEALVIGEHGESAVPVWSLANMLGMRLPGFAGARGQGYERSEMDLLFRDTMDAGRQVIKRKGATYYGVAASLARIVEAVLQDQNAVLLVSTVLQDDAYGLNDVCLSLPVVVNRGGLAAVLPLCLNPEEISGLHRSAQLLKAAIAQLAPIRTGPASYAETMDTDAPVSFGIQECAELGTPA